jgi:hypothetical protein
MFKQRRYFKVSFFSITAEAKHKPKGNIEEETKVKVFIHYSV